MLKPSAITLLFIIVAMTLELAVSVNFDKLTRFETQPTYLSFIRQEIPEAPIFGDHITADYELAVHSTMVNQSNKNEYFSLAIFGASFMKWSKADRTFIYKVSKYRFTDNSTNANATTTGNQNGKFMTDYLRMIKKDQETTLDSPDPDPKAITIEPRSFEGKNAQLIIETTENLMSWRFRISFGPENAYVFWWTIDYGKREIKHFDVYRNSAEIISEDPSYNVLAGKLKHSLTKITESSELNHIQKLNHSFRVQLRAFDLQYRTAFMLNLWGVAFTQSNPAKDSKPENDEYEVQSYKFSAIPGSNVNPKFDYLIALGIKENAKLRISHYSNTVTTEQVTTNFKFILTMETKPTDGTWELKWEMAFSDDTGTLVYLQVTKPRHEQKEAETQVYSKSPKNAMLSDYTSSD